MNSFLVADDKKKNKKVLPYIFYDIFFYKYIGNI